MRSPVAARQVGKADFKPAVSTRNPPSAPTKQPSLAGRCPLGDGSRDEQDAIMHTPILPSGNLFADLSAAAAASEQFDTLWETAQVRIERIVSTGQSTPAETWLHQDRDEWVLLLRGSAALLIEGEPEARRLQTGDHLLIPALTRQRDVDHNRRAHGVGRRPLAHEARLRRAQPPRSPDLLNDEAPAGQRCPLPIDDEDLPGALHARGQPLCRMNPPTTALHLERNDGDGLSLILPAMRNGLAGETTQIRVQHHPLFLPLIEDDGSVDRVPLRGLGRRGREHHLRHRIGPGGGSLGRPPSGSRSRL